MNAILVIEDEAQIRSNIQEILELGDFQAIAAANGRIGLELAKKHLPDLIICDVMMPEMDGLEVLEHLRDDPKTSLIPFIFLSAKVEKSDQRKGMKFGADDYLTKPFTAEELLEAVAARLERSAVQKAKLEEVTEKLKEAADVDRLTGLPNESALAGDDGYLSRSIAQINKENRFIAFLLMGLDRLNEINKELGYSKGNILLKEVAERLQNFVLEENISVVRMEGNTFALVFPPSKDDGLAVKIGRQILAVIAEPVKLEGLTVPITASIGIAFYPNATNLEELRRQAGIALSKARNDGGNLCLIYKPQLFGNKIDSDLKLAAEFHQAWQQKTIKVAYQPRVNPRNKKIVGVGTTIQWDHPYLGEIPPSKIMDLAEKSGLTASLGEWMLENAILQGKKWLDRGVRRQVSVTLFPALFNEENLEFKISSCLQKSGLKPEFLELEIPAETITKASNLNLVGSKLIKLQKMGATVTIYQFNLEHTSCHYLQELAIDKIKIDRVLIANLNQNSPIIATLTKIASNLKLKIVADGVQTEAQVKALAKQRVDEIQYDSLLVMGNNN